ncbi:MAG: PIG-L deacetylase family protein [Armatimonadota bacterium]|nr:PIG-L deacetylase family protein [Armatimonadota bacterium]MDR5701972.1 PIG-L deacetylase family protein [Armatimonadota bacterium]MDR7434730.1 PIG-L deacetylase family protein [Armatimonadota bacterium]
MKLILQHPTLNVLILLGFFSFMLWGLLFIRLMVSNGGVRPGRFLIRRGSLKGVQRALVVVAHPDDAEVYCGGSVATLTRLGVPVTLVICADGGKIYYQFGRRLIPNPLNGKGGRLVRLREEEQRRSARILGIKEVIFLRHPDGLLDWRNLVSQLREMMQRFAPDLVVTFDGEEPSHLEIRDHLAVGRAVLSAAREVGIPRVLCFSTRRPNVVVDTTPVMSLRWKALTAHRSQFHGVRGRLAVRILRGLARRNGTKIGVPYGEAFREIWITRGSSFSPPQ